MDTNQDQKPPIDLTKVVNTAEEIINVLPIIVHCFDVLGQSIIGIGHSIGEAIRHLKKHKVDTAFPVVAKQGDQVLAIMDHSNADEIAAADIPAAGADHVA